MILGFLATKSAQLSVRFLAVETQESSQDYSTNFAPAEKLLTPGCLKRAILNHIYLCIYIISSLQSRPTAVNSKTTDSMGNPAVWTCCPCFNSVPRKCFFIVFFISKSLSGLSWVPSNASNSSTAIQWPVCATKNLVKTLSYKKCPKQPSSCQNWKSPNTALGTRNLVDNIWISPTRKGEAGRHVSFDLVSCPSFYFHSAEEKSL